MYSKFELFQKTGILNRADQYIALYKKKNNQKIKQTQNQHAMQIYGEIFKNDKAKFIL